MAGHDHVMQVLECDGITMIGNGAGSRIHQQMDTDYPGLLFGIGGRFGFMSHQLTKETAWTHVYGARENHATIELLYSHRRDKGVRREKIALNNEQDANTHLMQIAIEHEGVPALSIISAGGFLLLLATATVFLSFMQQSARRQGYTAIVDTRNTRPSLFRL